MRNKHFLSLMMAAALVVCASFTSGTTNAAELDENTGDQTVTINYTVNSTWSVTVPATITGVVLLKPLPICFVII